MSTFIAKQAVGLLRFNNKKVLFIAFLVLTLLLNLSSGIADANPSEIGSKQANRTIKGQSGGTVDSQGCGFVSTSPSYEINLKEKVDYMRFTVQADGGQPTLLVIGPNSDDSFCVLGDEISGLKPEISGVWEAGYYQIYIGDRTSSQHNFTLNISTDN
ncbi:MAG: hypothetical protein AAGE84_07610 [Cyanobacteria bacterium P01_G01_bin.39]